MPQKSLDWEDLKFLGCVAKHKSVRASAKSLGVHHSTVSRRIDSLEHAAGTRLFSRTPEGYVLTEAGELLASTANDIESKVLRAQRLVEGGDKALSGRLHISMPEPVALHVFAQHMPEFQQSYPELEVSISSSYSFADLSRQQADIVIRATRHPDESLFGKRLYSYHTMTYATSEYFGRLADANARKNCVWIGWDSSYEKHPEWTKNTGFEDIPVWGNFTDINMQVALAKAGAGLAQLPCFLGDPEPDLMRAKNHQPMPDRDFWLLTHTDLKNSRKVRTFMKFAEDTMLQYKDRFQGKL